MFFIKIKVYYFNIIYISLSKQSNILYKNYIFDNNQNTFNIFFINNNIKKMEFEEPQKFVAFTAPSSEKLQVEICDPKKETDGTNFFTTYLIKSKVYVILNY